MITQPRVLTLGCFPRNNICSPFLFRRKPKCRSSGYFSLHWFLLSCSLSAHQQSLRRLFPREVFRELSLTHLARLLAVPISPSLTRRPGRLLPRPRRIQARSILEA